MPLEYHAKVIDLTVDDEINKGQSVAFILAGLLAVLLLIQAAVRSWRLAGLAYLALPSALLGGVVALLILGDGITIATGRRTPGRPRPGRPQHPPRPGSDRGGRQAERGRAP